jgi:O-antigen ligase
MRRLLLAIIVLDIPLQVDTHLYYRSDAAAMGALGGLNISLTTISLAGLYLLWLSDSLTSVGSRLRPLFRLNLPLALYLGFVALSILAARDITLSLFELFLFLQMFLLYIYIANSVRTREEVLFVVKLLLIGLILESVLMIGLANTGQSFGLEGVSTRIDTGKTATESSRVAGTIGSANSAAAYLCMLLAVAMSVQLTPLRAYYKWLAVVALGLGAGALILTSSRGGWTTFGLSTMILCGIAWRRGRLSLKSLLVMFVIVVFVFSFFQGAILTRLSADDRGSAYSRIPLMKLALRIVGDNPMLGVGANNFSSIMDQYITLEFSHEFLYAVHNQYLLIWVETGIGGLITFVWFLVAAIRRGWQCSKSSDPFLSPLAIGLTAGVVGFMAHMSVELFRGRPLTQLVWFVAGLITAIRDLAGEDRGEEEDVRFKVISSGACG